MSGIQYITDENGNKTAVVIDLKKHFKLWEDISDQLVAEKRKNQKRYNHSDVKMILKKEGKL